MLTLGVPLTAQSGPLIVEEVARITSPEPDFAFGAPFGSGVSRVAIDGDFMLVSGTRQMPDSLDVEQAVFFFRRNTNGTWAYVRKIASSIEDRADFSRDKPVAMRDGVAAIGGLITHILERSGDDYVQVTQLPFINGADIEIHSATVLFSESNGTWDARAFRRNASGQWTEAGRVTGDISGGDDDQTGRDVDIWGTSIIVANPNRNQLEFTFGHARHYAGPIGNWTELTDRVAVRAQQSRESVRLSSDDVGRSGGRRRCAVVRPDVPPARSLRSRYRRRDPRAIRGRRGR